MKAKVVLFMLILFLFLSDILHGQNAGSVFQVSAELLGSSDIYSVNFEYIQQSRHSFQAGISWLPGTWQVFAENDRSFLNIPLVYHYLYGANPHKLDLAVGLLQTSILNRNAPNQFKFRPEMGLAYRFQREKGIFCSAGVYLKAPFALSADANAVFLYKENRFLPWPSVAMGWSF